MLLEIKGEEKEATEGMGTLLCYDGTEKIQSS